MSMSWYKQLPVARSLISKAATISEILYTRPPHYIRKQPFSDDLGPGTDLLILFFYNSADLCFGARDENQLMSNWTDVFSGHKHKKNMGYRRFCSEWAYHRKVQGRISVPTGKRLIYMRSIITNHTTLEINFYQWLPQGSVIWILLETQYSQAFSVLWHCSSHPLKQSRTSVVIAAATLLSM